jgi:hypothetical protein
MREARKAGRSPPTRPMMSAKRRDRTAIERVTAKLKASSEKVWKLTVEMVMN